MKVIPRQVSERVQYVTRTGIVIGGAHVPKMPPHSATPISGPHKRVADKQRPIVSD